MPPYISAYPPVLIFLPPSLCSFICMHLLSSPPSLFSVLFTSPTILRSLNPRHSSLKAHLSFNYTYTSTGHVFHISSPRERQGTWERDAAEQVFLSWGIFLNTSLSLPLCESSMFCILTAEAAWGHIWSVFLSLLLFSINLDNLYSNSIAIKQEPRVSVYHKYKSKTTPFHLFYKIGHM